MGVKDRVFYDTWAWREIAIGSAVGRRLQRRYGPDGPGEVHTSVLALAEAGSILARNPKAGVQAAEREVRRMESRSRVHGLELEDVLRAVRLRPELRRADGSASLADALMLAQARRLGLRFISGDKGFRGQADVGTA